MPKTPEPDPLDDPALYQPYSCPACDRCFLDMRALQAGVVRCHYGGPFKGYEEVSN